MCCGPKLRAGVDLPPRRGISDSITGDDHVTRNAPALPGGLSPGQPREAVVLLRQEFTVAPKYASDELER